MRRQSGGHHKALTSSHPHVAHEVPHRFFESLRERTSASRAEFSSLGVSKLLDMPVGSGFQTVRRGRCLLLPPIGVVNKIERRLCVGAGVDDRGS
jgi:hypothetical protein